MAGEFDAGSAVGRLILAHEELGKALADVKSEFKKFGDESTKSVSKVGEAWSSVKKAFTALAIYEALKKVGEFAVECVKKFAELETASTSANRALAYWGTTWNNFRDQARAATGNLVSDLDLAKTSADALFKGMKPDDLLKAFEAADVIAKSTGQDINEVTKQISDGMMNQKSRTLQALGVIVDSDQAYQNYARSIGTTVDKLTAQQRQTAFNNAVTRELDRITRGASGSQRDLSDNVQRVRTALTNAMTAIGQWIATSPTLKFWIDQLASAYRFWESAIWGVFGAQKNLNLMSAATLKNELAASQNKIQAKQKEIDSVDAAPPTTFQHAMGVLAGEQGAEQIKLLKEKDKKNLKKELWDLVARESEIKVALAKQTNPEPTQFRPPASPAAPDGGAPRAAKGPSSAPKGPSGPSAATQEANRRHEEALRLLEQIERDNLSEEAQTAAHYQDMRKTVTAGNLGIEKEKHALALIDQLEIKERQKSALELIEELKKDNLNEEQKLKAHYAEQVKIIKKGNLGVEKEKEALALIEADRVKALEDLRKKQNEVAQGIITDIVNSKRSEAEALRAAADEQNKLVDDSLADADKKAYAKILIEEKFQKNLKQLYDKELGDYWALIDELSHAGETEAQKQARLAQKEWAGKLKVLREGNAKEVAAGHITQAEADDRYQKAVDLAGKEISLIQSTAAAKIQAEKASAKAVKDEQMASIAGTATDLFIKNEEDKAKIKGLIEVAESARAGATFAETMDPQYLLASLQHALAAKAYFEAARTAARGPHGGGGGGGKDKNKKDEPQLTKEAAPTNIEVNFYGGVLNGAALQEWMVNDFAPNLREVVNSGRVNLTTAR